MGKGEATPHLRRWRLSKRQGKLPDHTRLWVARHVSATPARLKPLLFRLRPLLSSGLIVYYPEETIGAFRRVGLVAKCWSAPLFDIMIAISGVYMCN